MGPRLRQTASALITRHEKGPRNASGGLLHIPRSAAPTTAASPATTAHRPRTAPSPATATTAPSASATTAAPAPTAGRTTAAAVVSAGCPLPAAGGLLATTVVTARSPAATVGIATRRPTLVVATRGPPAAVVVARAAAVVGVAAGRPPRTVVTTAASRRGGDPLGAEVAGRIVTIARVCPASDDLGSLAAGLAAARLAGVRAPPWAHVNRPVAPVANCRALDTGHVDGTCAPSFDAARSLDPVTVHGGSRMVLATGSAPSLGAGIATSLGARIAPGLTAGAAPSLALAGRLGGGRPPASGGRAVRRVIRHRRPRVHAAAQRRIELRPGNPPSRWSVDGVVRTEGVASVAVISVDALASADTPEPVGGLISAVAIVVQRIDPRGIPAPVVRTAPP